MTAPLDEQDPLPENKWFWRRLFAYVVTAVALGLVGWIVSKLASPEPLAHIAYWLIGLCALLATYYLIAPSAEHVVRMVGHIKGKAPRADA